MATDLETAVWDALKEVKFPGMSRDIVSFGFVSRVRACAGSVIVDMQMSTHNPAAAEKVQEAAEKAVRTVPEVNEVKINLSVVKPQTREESAQKAIAQDTSLIPEVRNVVAVASGKGGVGKSTVAANLAVTLGQLGYRVGLLDADIYGPNIPTMFGERRRPAVTAESKIEPLEAHGVRLMSLGFLLDPDQAAIMRGPMISGILKQFLEQVEWGELDWLVIDMPPGTGDAQLSLVQTIRLDGVVMVTTPQDVATGDVLRGIKMFERTNTPVLGVVENMAGFICPCCGERYEIFGRAGGQRLAMQTGVELLGEVPLEVGVREGGDAGVPILVADPHAPAAEALRGVADRVAEKVEAPVAAPA